VTFTCGANAVTLRPVIDIARRGRVWALIRAGGGYSPPTAHMRVEVFRFDQSQRLPIGRFDCLTAFFRYGIHQCIQQRVYVRPRVVVRNVDSLKKFLPANRNEFMRRALMASGAFTCEVQ
jgi:hypothetical protein